MWQSSSFIPTKSPTNSWSDFLASFYDGKSPSFLLTLTTPPGSPLPHRVLPRDVTRKTVLPTDGIRDRRLRISFLPDRHDILLVPPLQLFKLMLMTFFLTLRYQMMVQRMKYNLQLIARSILYHPLTKMIIARNPNLRNTLHLIQV